VGKISHEPAGRGRGSPPYEGAIVSKEDVDILRALLATQTLWEAVSKAKARVDAATWYATGGPEAEDFLDAIDHGGSHPLLRLWVKRKGTVNAHRPGPGLRERDARRLVVVMCATLERAGIGKREVRERVAKRLGKEKIFSTAPSAYAIERWQSAFPPHGQAAQKVIAGAIARCGPIDTQIVQYFMKLVRVSLDPFP
jgi:hypothetical protein